MKVVYLSSDNSSEPKRKKIKSEPKQDCKRAACCREIIDFTASDKDGNPASVLDALLGSPKTSELFLRHHFLPQEDGWNRQIPVVIRGCEERVKLLKSQLFDLNIRELLHSSASDEIQVWLRSLQHQQGHSGISGAIKVSDPDQAHALYNAGNCLYCRGPEDLEKATVLPLINELGLGLSPSANPTTDRFTRGEVEMFYSYKGHITDTHTDFQENFTVQLTGVKKWTFRKSPIEAPLRGYSPHFGEAQGQDVKEIQLKGVGACQSDKTRQSTMKLLHTLTSNEENNPEDYCSVTLFPGDVLYHPAGIFHKVECLEDSIAFNISLYAASAAEVFCSSLQQYLWKCNSIFRQPILRNRLRIATQGNYVLKLVDKLKGAVQDFDREVSAADIIPFPCLENLNCKRKQVPSSSSSPAAHSDDDSNSEGELEGDDESETEQEEEDNLMTIDVLQECIATQNSTNLASDCAEYRFNPIAHLIFPEDLIAMGSQHDSAKYSRYSSYIVHVGYGNESLESLSRREVVFPKATSNDESSDSDDQKLAMGCNKVELLMRRAWLSKDMQQWRCKPQGIFQVGTFIALEKAGLLTRCK